MGALVGSGDVLRELRRVFGNPKSTAYATAQSKKTSLRGLGSAWATGRTLSPPIRLPELQSAYLGKLTSRT